MDETQLIHTADSSVEAFVELYRRHVTRVYRYHMAYFGNTKDAEDLTSQTFMAALAELRSFRGNGSFAMQIMEIAAKKRLKDLRGSRRELSNDAVLYYQSSSLPTDRSTTQRLESEAISRALKQISSDRTEAIALHFFGDLTYSEVSQVLKKSPEASGVLISRGMDDLLTHTTLSLGQGNLESQRANDLNLEGKPLLDKLSNIASQIVPDPLFVSDLEQALIANHRPKTKWRLPLQQLASVAGWVTLLALGAFLLNWRVTPSPSSIHHVATGSPTSHGTEIVSSEAASNPKLATARPTTTRLPTQKYIVQAGDTCTYIAGQFGVTIDQLINLNHLNSTCDIWIDQELLIPITTPTPTN